GSSAALPRGSLMVSGQARSEERHRGGDGPARHLAGPNMGVFGCVLKEERRKDSRFARFRFAGGLAATYRSFRRMLQRAGWPPVGLTARREESPGSTGHGGG